MIAPFILAISAIVTMISLTVIAIRRIQIKRRQRQLNSLNVRMSIVRQKFASVGICL